MNIKWNIRNKPREGLGKNAKQSGTDKLKYRYYLDTKSL